VRRVELPIVARIETGDGSHIEPPLDQSWDEATKLAWHAAAVAADTGLRIHVHDEAASNADGREIPGWYALSIGHTGCSAMDYGTAWTYLNGVVTGAREAR
jgi:hypothetical protein